MQIQIKRIPDELIQEIELLVATKSNLSHRSLNIKIKGLFAYLNEENMPLCRIKYIGDSQLWEFAIYKASSGRYSKEEFGFPSLCKIEDSIEIALAAYQ